MSNGSNKAVCCGQAADAREVLAQNLGVPTEDILNTVVTQIHAGDQVNFTLSIVEMIPVQELLPAGWRVSRTIIAGIWVAFFRECQQQSCGQVLEAEVQLCDESSFGAVRNDSAKNIVDCIKQYGQLQVNQVRTSPLNDLGTFISTAVERVPDPPFVRVPAGG